MKKNNKDISRHIVIFVEGDTDELFFKALVEHYKAKRHCYRVKCAT